MYIDQHTTSRFSGTIEYIRLIDLIQVSCLAKMSHTIKVDAHEKAGRIYLDSGNVVHAESDNISGEEGLFELFKWDMGHFETLSLPEKVAVSITRAWEYLLIQAIRLTESLCGDSGDPAARVRSRGFWGKINDIALTDLVQLVCLDSVDRIVEIRSETFSGTIVVREGQISHAQTGDLAGQEAFLKILAISGGSFETLASSKDYEVTINLPWQHLLLESMRSLDESSGQVDEENEKKRAETLLQKIQGKNVAEKIRLAMFADKETRTILIRDGNRMVQAAVISNPRITDGEVAAIASSRQVDEEVLRRIGTDREWTRIYPVRLALASNPKTPVTIARKIVPTLNRLDLRNLSRSKSVSNLVATEALRHLSE